MARVTRKEIFAKAAKRLRQEFAELSTVPHNALKGSEAEELVRRFLREHIPKRFDVASGFVMDPEDTVSRQTDVLVYDAFNCPVYRASENAGIFPSDNVAAVVEVKIRLTRERLREAFQNIAETKSLKKRDAREPRGHIRAQTYGCIFAFDSDLSLETISEIYAELVKEFGIGAHPDLMVLLDKAVFSLAANIPGTREWATASIEGLGGAAGEGGHLAVSYATTAEESLDYFLRLLLANLMIFRSVLDHPGFDFRSSPSQGKVHLRYLTSITQETDPQKAEQKLKEYARQARRLLDETITSDTVIELPGPKAEK